MFILRGTSFVPSGMPRYTVLENYMIDLNRATAAELDEVPALQGHGFEIVRCRDERGRFDRLRQLNEVPGLTGKADGLEGEVTVG